MPVESLRLYSEDRCWWCARKMQDSPPRHLEHDFGKKRYDVLVCSEECEQSCLKAFAFVQKRAPWFLTGIILSVILIVLPKFATTAAGFFLLGTTILLFPFCTPQTTQLVGMRRSFILGRVLGGAVLAWAVYFVIRGGF